MAKVKEIEVELTTHPLAHDPRAAETHAAVIRLLLERARSDTDPQYIACGLVTAFAAFLCQNTRDKRQALAVAYSLATDLVQTVSLNYDTIVGAIDAADEMDRVLGKR